jgi:hypothetical protein
MRGRNTAACAAAYSAPRTPGTAEPPPPPSHRVTPCNHPSTAHRAPKVALLAALNAPLSPCYHLVHPPHPPCTPPTPPHAGPPGPRCSLRSRLTAWAWQTTRRAGFSAARSTERCTRWGGQWVFLLAYFLVACARTNVARILRLGSVAHETILRRACLLVCARWAGGSTSSC